VTRSHATWLFEDVTNEPPAFDKRHAMRSRVVRRQRGKDDGCRLDGFVERNVQRCSSPALSNNTNT
jgi:hypothetical protein